MSRSRRHRLVFPWTDSTEGQKMDFGHYISFYLLYETTKRPQDQAELISVPYLGLNISPARGGVEGP